MDLYTVTGGCMTRSRVRHGAVRLARRTALALCWPLNGQAWTICLWSLDGRRGVPALSLWYMGTAIDCYLCFPRPAVVQAPLLRCPLAARPAPTTWLPRRSSGTTLAAPAWRTARKYGRGSAETFIELWDSQAWQLQGLPGATCTTRCFTRQTGELLGRPAVLVNADARCEAIEETCAQGSCCVCAFVFSSVFAAVFRSRRTPRSTASSSSTAPRRTPCAWAESTRRYDPAWCTGPEPCRPHRLCTHGEVRHGHGAELRRVWLLLHISSDLQKPAFPPPVRSWSPLPLLTMCCALRVPLPYTGHVLRVHGRHLHHSQGALV